MKNRSGTNCRCSRISLSVAALVFFLLFLAPWPCQCEQKIRLGVLAKRGYQTAMKRWNPLAGYLTKKTGINTTIVPLSFSQVPEYVSQNKVELILANQKFYVSLKKQFGIRALATVINSRGGPFMGGVIFTRKDSPIKGISQLRGKRIGIVSFGSGGGFLIQAYDLLRKGLNVIKESDIKPMEGQDYVVYAVLNQAVDAGFVRTGQLESMAREKKIALKDFRILSPQEHPDFPLLCSTSQLWPAWPVSATSQLSNSLAARIKNALLGIQPGSRAAKTARIKGFAPPGDYSPVAEAFKAVGQTR